MNCRAHSIGIYRIASSAFHTLHTYAFTVQKLLPIFFASHVQLIPFSANTTFMRFIFIYLSFIHYKFNAIFRYCNTKRQEKKRKPSKIVSEAVMGMSRSSSLFASRSVMRISFFVAWQSFRRFLLYMPCSGLPLMYTDCTSTSALGTNLHRIVEHIPKVSFHLFLNILHTCNREPFCRIFLCQVLVHAQQYRTAIRISCVICEPKSRIIIFFCIFERFMYLYPSVKVARKIEKMEQISLKNAC